VVETSCCKSYKKRKKKTKKRVQASAKNNQKKRSKESGKRSTLESQPSFEFESIFLLHFTVVPVLSVCTLFVFVLSQKLAIANPDLIFASCS